MSDTNIIATDAQNLVMTGEDNALISLYELEISGSSLYFHSENTEDAIEFDGKSYVAFPMVLEDVETNGDGASPRPRLTIPNVDSILSSDSELRSSSSWLGRDFIVEDLIGSRITRRQTLKKYTGVGATAYEFPTDVYVIDRISSRNQLAIELELASPFDFSGARVPSRIVTGKYCPWLYQGYSESNTDVKSACDWQNQITFASNIYALFFTQDDEPILKEDITEVTSATAWSVSNSYTADSLVTYDGLLWMSKAVVPVGSEPYESSIYWKLCRTFSVWSTDVGSYTTDPVDPRKNSYVYHNGNVWRVTRAHTKDANIEPGVNFNYWTYGDSCGKLLNSCKVRYQAKIRESSGTGTSAVPKVGTFDTQFPLPFGGFPGTRRFR